MAGIDNEALRVLMDMDGSSVVSLSQRVGISRQYLGDVLAGRRTLKRNPALVKKLADELGVPSSMLRRSA